MKLINQLDLNEHIEQFKSFFARFQTLYMEGDQELHYRYIKALDNIEFNSPVEVMDLSNIKLHLKKYGVLHFNEIFEIVKIVRYFRYFKNKKLDGIIGEWLEKIVIEPLFFEIDNFFLSDGSFDESKDERLYGLAQKTKELKQSINESLKRAIHTQKLASYLIDSQVHYINDEEALLVRGGFNHVLKGAIVGRSSGGGFYVSPDSILKLKEQIRYVNQEREALFYNYAKEFSVKLASLLPFINFIDKEFSRLDAYQARVKFAQAKNLSILKSKKDTKIDLVDFIHPALHNAKPISVDFSKNILMITGVNAGGKTMLLKSILSASFMARYIIPQKINEHKSHIGNFKNITAIIDDPQNVKNDISTFAGRMQEFSSLLAKRDTLVGVDEIELGTDSDEAAALFKVLLDELVQKNQKIVVTTHHKRLASLMADRDDVELMAAIYDEQNRTPTYEFMQGIIGKSYAFETALRYGVPNKLVSAAKELYGQNSEKLNILIERGSTLERELKQKHKLVDEKLDELYKKELELKEQKEHDKKELSTFKNSLRLEYEKAINEAKKAAKEGSSQAVHKAMNKAKELLPKKEYLIKSDEPYIFSVGDRVKYNDKKGVIVALKDGKEATIEMEGIRLKVQTYSLKPSNDKIRAPKIDVKLQVEKKSGLKLDLHGLRADEALENLDKFISDALINGWDEVLVYHGIGSGKLAYAVKEFLKSHPKVKSFSDAPVYMGGFGAKVVEL